MSKWYIFPIIMLLAFTPLILFISFHEPTKKIERTNLEQLTDCRKITKFKYVNHSYIFIHNSWSCAGDAYLHDPDCECVNKGK